MSGGGGGFEEQVIEVLGGADFRKNFGVRYLDTEDGVLEFRFRGSVAVDRVRVDRDGEAVRMRFARGPRLKNVEVLNVPDLEDVPSAFERVTGLRLPAVDPRLR